jgi:hypothetical protein
VSEDTRRRKRWAGGEGFELRPDVLASLRASRLIQIPLESLFVLAIAPTE